MQGACTSATGTAPWSAKLLSQAMSTKHGGLENVREEKQASQAGCTSPKWARPYAEPSSTSKKHPPKHAAHHQDQDQCGSVPIVSYGLCSWHSWGWQGPPATEGGLTGSPSVSAFQMLQYLTSHQKSQSKTTAQNPLLLDTSSKARCSHKKSNPTCQATIPYST